MAFRHDRCAAQQVSSAFRRLVFSLAVISIVAAGCGRRTQTSPNIPPPLPDTPDGKLEGVMRRFKAALQDAHSAAGSGVKSMRTASYRRLEPAADESVPNAEITVTTTVAVDRHPPAENPEELAKQPLDEQKGPEKKPPGTIEPVINSESFVLTYDGSYWKIVEQPKDDIIRLCIAEALKGQ